QLAHEGGNGNVEIEIAHGGAADDAHDVGEEGEQRQCDHQPDDARQDQRVDGVEADGLHRVDLFIDAHGADLGGEGRAGASGDDDRGHQYTHLAQGEDAKAVDGEHLGAELPQLVDALIRDNHSD